MANETLSELKYNGNKVVAEVARRDICGKHLIAKITKAVNNIAEGGYNMEYHFDFSKEAEDLFDISDKLILVLTIDSIFWSDESSTINVSLDGTNITGVSYNQSFFDTTLHSSNEKSYIYITSKIIFNYSGLINFYSSILKNSSTDSSETARVNIRGTPDIVEGRLLQNMSFILKANSTYASSGYSTLFVTLEAYDEIQD